MNQAVKVLVQALRSGDYEQETGMLRNGNHYCCLGVACNIYKELTGDGEWAEADSRYGFIAAQCQKRDIMPEAVKKFFGFKWNDGGLGVESAVGSLSEANDTGKTFAEIADIIEEYEKELFVGGDS